MALLEQTQIQNETAPIPVGGAAIPPQVETGK